MPEPEHIEQGSENQPPSPLKITCPSCKCVISSDGKERHKISPEFEKLEADAALVTGLQKDVADLQEQVRKLGEQPATEPDPEPLKKSNSWLRNKK